MDLTTLKVMKMFFVSILLVGLVVVSPVLFHGVRGQNSVSVMYVSPVSSSLLVNQTFAVSVGLNLSSSDGISGYDVLLRSDFFNDTFVGPVLQPLSIQPGNAFQGRDNLTLADCVNGSGSGCNPALGDGLGAVHSAMTVLGDPVPGGQSVSLFSATFKVVGKGVTLLEIVNDNVTYDPPVPGYGPNNLIVLHLTYSGVFSNLGVAAFFNVASPAIRVPGVPVVFDASASFNPNGAAITSYSWDFGDGSKNSTTTPSISHRFDNAGTYRVILKATDGSSWSSITRTLAVSSTLGALKIFPIPVPPRNASYQGSITVSLFNTSGSGSSLVAMMVKPPQSSWVLFTGLKAGDYRADFSGDGVVTFSKLETVTAGWTAWDTVYFPVTVSTPAGQPDYSFFSLLGLVGVGVALGAVALLYRRRGERKKRRKSPKSRSRAR